MTIGSFYKFHSRYGWVCPLLLLVAVILFFEMTPLDIVIQDCFYSAEDGWLIEKDDTLLRFCYYQGPKITLIPLFVLMVLAGAVKAVRYMGGIPWKHVYVLLCLIAIPSVVAVLKSVTNIPYPRKIVRYGGIEQHRTLKDVFTGRMAPVEKRYNGWPGGHSSGGFGMMGAAFASEDRRRRRFGFIAATLLGFFMGIGHTIDGNHFFSHTLVTFCIAWLISAVLYRLMLPLLRRSNRRREVEA